MSRGQLPNAERAVVRRSKIVEYLLSESHPDGRGKSRFFSGHGFSSSEWETLAAALRGHALEHPVLETVETPFGVRYVVEGEIIAPDGRKPHVRTVWFIRTNGNIPELVTAYPMRRRF